MFTDINLDLLPCTKKKKNVIDFFTSLAIKPQSLNSPTNSRLDLNLSTYFLEVGVSASPFWDGAGGEHASYDYGPTLNITSRCWLKH